MQPFGRVRPCSGFSSRVNAALRLAVAPLIQQGAVLYCTCVFVSLQTGASQLFLLLPGPIVFFSQQDLGSDVPYGHGIYSKGPAPHGVELWSAQCTR